MHNGISDICLENCFISYSFCNMEEHKLVHSTHLRETEILFTEISSTTLLGAVVVI
jgi:hypothetical protein